MKKNLLMRIVTGVLFLFFVFQTEHGFAQISFKDGCYLNAQTLNLSGTVNDGSHVRNTYTSSDFSSGFVRVIWSTSNNRWEIQFDDAGFNTWDYLLYYNTTASYPNPPSLTLGTWQDGPDACSPISV